MPCLIDGLWILLNRVLPLVFDCKPTPRHRAGSRPTEMGSVHLQWICGVRGDVRHFRACHGRRSARTPRRCRLALATDPVAGPCALEWPAAHEAAPHSSTPLYCGSLEIVTHVSVSRESVDLRPALPIPLPSCRDGQGGLQALMRGRISAWPVRSWPVSLCRLTPQAHDIGDDVVAVLLLDDQVGHRLVRCPQPYG